MILIIKSTQTNLFKIKHFFIKPTVINVINNLIDYNI